MLLRFASALVGLFLCPSLVAQTQTNATQSLVGDWQLTTDLFGNPQAERLTLKWGKGQLAGFLSGRPVQVTVTGDNIHFQLQEEDSSLRTYDGRIAHDAMSGQMTVTRSVWDEGLRLSWTAERVPPSRTGPAKKHEFMPAQFHRAFSSVIVPALRISPGDTVHTRSVDAGGYDENGVARVLGGNPLTGPFYVEGALPGDVLAVTFKRLRLNRDYAISDDAFVSRVPTTSYARTLSSHHPVDVRWRLDLQRGVASLEKPTPHLKNLVVPLRPMLGCVGVAPGTGAPPLSAGDSGYLGGNMDYNQITEGTILYLSVNQPGALLYLGDGHAVQGDGELNGNALETSMDIEFSVEVQKEGHIGTPRAENAEYLMAIGLGGSLDEAFRRATSELAEWLQHDYNLSPGEASMVLGTSVEYNISEVADRNVGIVAKIRKQVLEKID